MMRTFWLTAELVLERTYRVEAECMQDALNQWAGSMPGDLPLSGENLKNERIVLAREIEEDRE